MNILIITYFIKMLDEVIKLDINTHHNDEYEIIINMYMNIFEFEKEIEKI